MSDICKFCGTEPNASSLDTCINFEAARHCAWFGTNRLKIVEAAEIAAASEITRLRADKAALVEALEAAHAALNDYTDVNDGPYGEPAPNLAMRTREIISAALAQAKAGEP